MIQTTKIAIYGGIYEQFISRFDARISLILKKNVGFIEQLTNTQ